MFCEDCKKQPATVHFKQQINNMVTVMHLCPGCANRRSGGAFWIDPGLATMNIFGFGQVNPQAQPGGSPGGAVQHPARAPVKCEKCGTEFSDFMSTGFLGCPACYQSFKNELSGVIAQCQGGRKHQGKIPLRRGGTVRARREIELLRSELESAVQSEEYEKAAEIRDRIRELEGGLSDPSDAGQSDPPGHLRATGNE